MATIIGITGSIASGKSQVTQYLTEKGFTVLDCDLIARQIAEPQQSGWQAVREQFGEGFFHADGTLNRRALGAYVFGDEERLKQLNSIMHPLIRAELNKQIRLHSGEERVFVDGAVLIESGMHDLCEQLWLIWAEDDVRLKRIMARDGLREQEARNRMFAQMPQEEKKQFATHILMNEGSLEQLYRAVDSLL
jgi:dephospho-CoA kinase